MSRLQQPDMALIQQPAGIIGERVGIQDIAKFRRAFRRWAGVTPREWRAK
jgi:AraC-like DNA-binding protein